MVDTTTLYFFLDHGMIKVYWGYIVIFIFSIERWDWPYYDDTCWDIALSLAMDFDLSWSIDTLDGLYWGIATSFIFIEPKDSDSYGLCWDVSIFGTRSRDWLVCWRTLGMILLNGCWLGYTILYWGIALMESVFRWDVSTLLDCLHWGISIFWKETQLIIYVGASDEWYRDHWIVSCYPHCILGHSHLVGCFDIETWLIVYDCCFRWIMELLIP